VRVGGCQGAVTKLLPEQGDKDGLRPSVPGAHLRRVHCLFGLNRGRARGTRAVFFSSVVLLLGTVAATFCPCICEHGVACATESAAGAPCHAHHAREASPHHRANHPCEHAACAGLTASLPSSEQPSSLTPFSSPDFFAVPASGGAISVEPDRVFAPLLGLDLGLGPPIPAPLFTVLRL